jgi:glucose-1-phosphate thymidylyltransferase
MTSQRNVSRQEIVGLIPAGGQATRIAPLPCSKELFPIGFRPTREGLGLRPKVVSQYLLEKMRFAGISKVYIVLRPGKWDIPAYFGDGSILDMHLAYLMLGAPFGVPFTLDQAYPFLREATVAFGFPDILFDSEEGFAKLLAWQESHPAADVILGLCQARYPASKEDRVDAQENGEVREIVVRPSESHLPHSWAIALWKPNFTRFLHDYVADRKFVAWEHDKELSAGHVIKAAMTAGLRIEGLVISNEPYLDIGTPEDLFLAVNNSARINQD